MKGVIDHIDVRATWDNKWKLLEPFDWYGITVPAGFVTDFASIPRPFWFFINPVGRIKPAAIVHDYLYHLRGEYELERFTRKEVDQIFLEIMKRVGMPFLKRQAAYRAVRAFGWMYWNKPKGESDQLDTRSRK